MGELKDTVDTAALANSFNTDFGHTSTPKTASYSVKMRFGGGDTIIVNYQAIVHFSTEHEYVQMKRLYEEEATAIVKEAVKNVKTSYKGFTGRAVKFSEIAREDSVEIINMNFYNPRRAAYYRAKFVFEVS
jgi:hypothetical protein